MEEVCWAPAAAVAAADTKQGLWYHFLVAICVCHIYLTQKRGSGALQSKVLVKEIVDNQMSLAVGLSSNCMYVYVSVCVCMLYKKLLEKKYISHICFLFFG